MDSNAVIVIQQLDKSVVAILGVGSFFAFLIGMAKLFVESNGGLDSEGNPKPSVSLRRQFGILLFSTLAGFMVGSVLIARRVYDPLLLMPLMMLGGYGGIEMVDFFYKQQTGKIFGAKKDD